MPLTKAPTLHIQILNSAKPAAFLGSEERFSLSSLLSVSSYHLDINGCLMSKEQNSTSIAFSTFARLTQLRHYLTQMINYVFTKMTEASLNKYYYYYLNHCWKEKPKLENDSEGLFDSCHDADKRSFFCAFLYTVGKKQQKPARCFHGALILFSLRPVLSPLTFQLRANIQDDESQAGLVSSDPCLLCVSDP